MEKLDYFEKKSLKDYQDLKWNIPERKTGSISIVGGNSENFANIIKSAEFLEKSFPLEKLNVVLPDSLKSKLPPLDNLVFTASTKSGSFDKSDELDVSLSSSDFNILLGDFSKNSATTVALTKALNDSSVPTVFARDTLDLLSQEMINLVEKEHLFITASMSQMQKFLRAIYYPKMLLLSMPLLQTVEVLHKLTLSYNLTILTFHQEQILIANSGKIIAIPISETTYTPISLWMGDLACKIAGMNLYNPNNELAATAAALI